MTFTIHFDHGLPVSAINKITSSHAISAEIPRSAAQAQHAACSTRAWYLGALVHVDLPFSGLNLAVEALKPEPPDSPSSQLSKGQFP